VLSGLEPVTAYVYRLLRSAPDGRRFASDVYAFRTPPGETDARIGPAVHDLRAVAASSELSLSLAAGHAGDGDAGSERSSAGDGDAGSEGSSAGDGDDAWIEIALPGPTDLSGVGVSSRTVTTRARIRRFRIVTDGGESFGAFELPDADGLHRFPVEASTGGDTGLVELEVFRAREPTCRPGPSRGTGWWRATGSADGSWPRIPDEAVRLGTLAR
jgi:hypothetical protein